MIVKRCRVVYTMDIFILVITSILWKFFDEWSRRMNTEIIFWNPKPAYIFTKLDWNYIYSFYFVHCSIYFTCNPRFQQALAISNIHRCSDVWRWMALLKVSKIFFSTKRKRRSKFLKSLQKPYKHDDDTR